MGLGPSRLTGLAANMPGSLSRWTRVCLYRQILAQMPARLSRQILMQEAHLENTSCEGLSQNKSR